MNRLRLALIAARGTPTTVTTIVMDHGFAHHGRLAAAYRGLFDETPGATLRGS